MAHFVEHGFILVSAWHLPKVFRPYFHTMHFRDISNYLMEDEVEWLNFESYIVHSPDGSNDS